MNNINLVRGVVLIGVALIFGIGSLNYQIGHFSRFGPGMFPLIVSCLLFFIGLITVVRARFVKAEAVSYNMKNIILVLLGLCGFALISQHLNMIVGIVFLVFFTGFAGKSYSVMRNVKIAAGLLAVAFAFQKLLGLNLPLL